MSAEELRSWWGTQLAPFAKPSLPDVSHQDLHIERDGTQIRIREYTPAGIGDHAPALVYLHGGGFCAYTIENYDGWCEFLAKSLHAKVYSVGYRLAPEHPFPIPLEDCGAAFSWVRENAEQLGIDPERVSLGGDSAGGNMTAALCLKLRDDGLPTPKAQLLVYPSTDLTSSFPSIQEFAEGQIITEAHLHWFHSNYAGDDQVKRNPYASPLFHTDHTNLPPAVMITAGFDPLRDEADAFVEKLVAAGVSVDKKEFPSLGHGFVFADATATVAKANKTIATMFKPLM